MVNFLQNMHNRHPIACPYGQAMGCLVWLQSLTYVTSLGLSSSMQCCVILEHVIMLYQQQMSITSTIQSNQIFRKFSPKIIAINLPHFAVVSEMWCVFCEFKIWPMLYHCCCYAVCYVMLYWSVLYQERNVHSSPVISYPIWNDTG